jgi:hypothetical protein
MEFLQHGLEVAVFLLQDFNLLLQLPGFGVVLLKLLHDGLLLGLESGKFLFDTLHSLIIWFYGFSEFQGGRLLTDLDGFERGDMRSVRVMATGCLHCRGELQWLSSVDRRCSSIDLYREFSTDWR